MDSQANEQPDRTLGSDNALRTEQPDTARETGGNAVATTTGRVSSRGVTGFLWETVQTFTGVRQEPVSSGSSGPARGADNRWRGILSRASEVQLERVFQACRAGADSSLVFTDWLHSISSCIEDMSPTSADLWGHLQAEASSWCASYMGADPIARLLLVPSPSQHLTCARWSRVSKRLEALFLRFLPQVSRRGADC